MAKKTFDLSDINNNPALSFIGSTESIAEQESRASEKQEEASNRIAPDGYRLNTRFVELKSRRVQLTMQPSLHAKVKAASEKYGLSFNDYVHWVLEKTMEEEGI